MAHSLFSLFFWLSSQTIFVFCLFRFFNIFLILTWGHCFFSLLFRERGREKGRERNIDVKEKHQLVAICRHPDLGSLVGRPGIIHTWPGNRTLNLGVCPDRESSWGPFALGDNAQPTEPHQSGSRLFICSKSQNSGGRKDLTITNWSQFFKIWPQKTHYKSFLWFLNISNNFLSNIILFPIYRWRNWDTKDEMTCPILHN